MLIGRMRVISYALQCIIVAITRFIGVIIICTSTIIVSRPFVVWLLIKCCSHHTTRPAECALQDMEAQIQAAVSDSAPTPAPGGIRDITVSAAAAAEDPDVVVVEEDPDMATLREITEFAKFDNHSYYQYPKIDKLIKCAEAATKAGLWPPMIHAAALCLESEPNMAVRGTVETFCNELIIAPTWERGRASLMAYIIARSSTLPAVNAMIPELGMWMKELFHAESMTNRLTEMLASVNKQNKEPNRVSQLYEAIQAYFFHT